MDSVTPMAAAVKLFFAWPLLGSAATLLADDISVEDVVVTFRIVITISERTDSTPVWPAISMDTYELMSCWFILMILFTFDSIKISIHI